MKIIRCLGDLREYGIEILTGEACNIGCRLLCDLTQRGVKLVAKTFGMPEPSFAHSGELIPGHSFAYQWNSGGEGSKKHVASIMLGYSDWQTLAIFALLDSPGCKEVWQLAATKQQELSYCGLYGGECLIKCNAGWEFTEDDENWKSWPEVYGKPIRRLAYSDTVPQVDGRNVHQMSGRVD